jgi:N-acetylglucosaminyl-diphospho-decaprenol L-rhamnosyltransferase
MARVDVVVVSYNSGGTLRACVAPLAGHPELRVTVVDNASPDGGLETVADLDVEIIRQPENRGFSHGCNAGWRSGSAPSVLFLNPDARIEPGAVLQLAAALDGSDRVGASAPKILHGDGRVDFSQRRFPRLGSTYAQALFLHRLFPRAGWSDELVRTDEAYAVGGRPEWVSGACVLVRRTALDALGGFDEGFFMYCEDTDLCKRLRDRGLEVRFVPEAVAVHEGGASAPRPSLTHVLARSRVRYARKHDPPVVALATRAGLALGAVTHLVVSRGGLAARAGHARALRAIVSRQLDVEASAAPGPAPAPVEAGSSNHP